MVKLQAICQLLGVGQTAETILAGVPSHGRPLPRARPPGIKREVYLVPHP